MTSTTYTGNLGGLAGADAKCQSAADDAGLGGTFKAWMSDSTTSAAARLSHSPFRYMRTDGLVVADSWDDLIDNPTNSPLHNPIGADENGSVVPNNVVWTGTTFSGNTIPGDLDCADWTDGTNAVSGRTGRANRVDLGWTSFATTGCDNTGRLYCLEQ